MKLRNLSFVLALAAALSPAASAKMQYLDAAELVYPGIVGTPLDSCSLCHSTGTNLNAYGGDYGSNSHNFGAIENLDSDNDGVKNGVEIDLLTFPGSKDSCPLVVKKPGNGVTWTIGTKVLVAWTSTDTVGANVDIELWQNGAKVKTLKKGTPNDGKQRIALKDTLPTGTGFTIRVRSSSNSAVSNVSKGSFTIAPAGP